jgi:hypothetical protein
MNQGTGLMLLLGVISPMALGSTCKDKAGNSVPIRAAERAEYRAIQDGHLWPNPYVLVSEKDGLAVIVSPSKDWQGGLTYEQVINLLDQQSCESWPFGAVVWMSIGGGLAGLSSKSAELNMTVRTTKLKNALEDKHIVVVLVPGA